MKEKAGTTTRSSGSESQTLKVQYIDQEPPLAHFLHGQASLEEVIEDLPEGYYEADLRGNLVAFNRALCRLHGYPPEVMANMSYREFTAPETHKAIFRAFSEVYETGRSIQILDYPVLRPDDTLCIIHTSVHLVRDEKGEATGFRGISRDVTDRHRNEQYENARMHVLENIARNAPLEKTLDAILLSLKAQMETIGGMFFCEKDNHLHCLARVNVPGNFESFLNGEFVSPNGKIYSRAAFQREPIIAECVETDPRCSGYRKMLMDCGVKSIWAYPVIGSDECLLGVLSVYSGTKRAPLEREARWIHSAIATAEIAIEHHRMTSELSFLSRHDTLTGILNRRSFMAEAERIFSLAIRKGWASGMLFLDLDGFKEINDTWGHRIGDFLLIEVTRRLSGCLRQSDCLGRMGGDEFAIFVPEAGEEGVQVVANRILRAISEPFDLSGVIVSAGVSIGIALCTRDMPEISVESLLLQADEAMYHAKNNGLGWSFYRPEQQKVAREKAGMESLLRRSMANGELPVFYQPVCDVGTGRWEGVEALVRWNHPERGIIAASEFLPLAESRGLICDIDRYVLPRALEDIRDWHGWLSVNVSPLSLYRSDWAGFVRDALAANDFPPQRLVLEITERVLLDMERVIGTLEELTREGVRIALDDFGKGYSSLSYLARLNVHCLKMDQGFIRNLNSRSRNTTLVEMLLALSKKLGVTAVAEGVEHRMDYEWLAENGCDLAQGFYLARPAPWTELQLQDS